MALDVVASSNFASMVAASIVPVMPAARRTASGVCTADAARAEAQAVNTIPAYFATPLPTAPMFTPEETAATAVTTIAIAEWPSSSIKPIGELQVYAERL